MKLKVLKPFDDFSAQKIRQAGEEFEVTKERYTELLKKLPPGFIEVVKVSKSKKSEVSE
ncbi:TPA: hypothetical protein ACHWJ6_000810 [Streptococcus suis]